MRRLLRNPNRRRRTKNQKFWGRRRRQGRTSGSGIGKITPDEDTLPLSLLFLEIPCSANDPKKSQLWAPYQIKSQFVSFFSTCLQREMYSAGRALRIDAPSPEGFCEFDCLKFKFSWEGLFFMGSRLTSRSKVAKEVGPNRSWRRGPRLRPWSPDSCYKNKTHYTGKLVPEEEDTSPLPSHSLAASPLPRQQPRNVPHSHEPFQQNLRPIPSSSSIATTPNA